MVPVSAERRLTSAGRRLLVAALLLAAAPAAAHAQASPVVPLDDIAYSYLDALIARGHLRSLSALERPYTVEAVRAALDSARVSGLGRASEDWVGRAERAVRKYDVPATEAAEGREAEGAGEFAASLSAGGLLTAQTSAARDLVLGDDSSGVLPGVTLRAVGRASHVVVASRLLVDQALKHDPAFTGRKNRSVAARVEDGYVAGQWRYGELFFGRVARSWGPYPLTGLQLGASPYTYDHLYGRFGNGHLWLSTLVTRLDPDSIAPDSIAQRWLAVHRLAARVGPVEAALSEAMLYGGVGRGLELAYLNPLNGYDLSQYNETNQGNVSFALDVAWRSRRGVLGAQLFLDDFQVDRCDTNCDEPPSYGLTLTLEGAPLAGAHRWFASYTRLSNLAYRTPQRWERWDYRGIGLGRAYSDYDEARLGLDLAIPGGAVLRPYAALRRQGEGDYRLPYPAPAAYASTPAFLAGTVERVTRVGVVAAATLGGWAELRGDVGMNRATSWTHVPGRAHSAFEGRVRVAIEPASLLTAVVAR